MGYFKGNMQREHFLAESLYYIESGCPFPDDFFFAYNVHQELLSIKVR